MSNLHSLQNNKDGASPGTRKQPPKITLRASDKEEGVEREAGVRLGMR